MAGVSGSVDKRWLRGPWWDLSLVAFGWLPFYAWVVFGLGVDGTWGASSRAALATATAIALGITYVHRHYTFLLVYGDGEAFARRPRGYVLAPLLTFGVVGGLRALHGATASSYPDPWILVVATVGAWNVWHTLMQRYGILRVYAGRAGGGLESAAQGRRDLALLWASTALAAVAVVVLRRSTFDGHPNARRALAMALPIVDGATGWILLASVASVVAVIAARWLRHERAATLRRGERAPRLWFLASTMALLGVLVVHGPIVGYLCFGVAHAVEYVAFVHHFGERRFAAAPWQRGLVARWMRRPLLFGPLITGALLALFVALDDYRRTDLYLVYYLGTSLLHFLYDGWIWKVRSPAVARPLGVGAPG